MDANRKRELRRLERDRRRREGGRPTYFSGAVATVAAGGARVAPHRTEGFDLQLGRIPLLGVTTALGLLLVTLANAASRQTVASLQFLFWIGMLLTYVPVVFRLLSPSPRRGERVLLVVLLGLALYLVTVMWAPFGFTGPDELAHQQSANTILETHRLFQPTSILPIAADYPGLEAVTAALASLSGLTTFGAGLIVIGAARIVMMLALFLLFERLSGSSRVGAVGAAVYAANENFVFFDAQFSYGSLAVPLLLAVLATVAEWRRGAAISAGTPPAPGPARRRRAAWASIGTLLIVATVVTHHVTSYILVALLVGLCVLYVGHPHVRLREAPLVLTGVAILAAGLWVGTVARPTMHYLWPVVHGAVTGTVQMILGQEAPRELFARAEYQPSWLERGTAILSWILLAAGCVLGSRTLLRKHRRDPFAILLAVVGVAFFGTLAGRYAAAAWETADRASGFLFIGLAFVIATIDFERWLPRRPRAFVWGLTSVLLGVCFAGGIIQGWDPKLRLAPPYVVVSKGRVITAEGRQLAHYAAAHLHGQRFAASSSDARLLAAHAGGYALTGGSPDLNDVLRSTDFPVWQQRLLGEHRIRYIVTDRRERSFDNSYGYYFGVRPPFGKVDVLLPERVVEKFDEAGLSKLYDSGNIAVFEYRPGAGRLTAPSDVSGPVARPAAAGS